MNYTSIYNPKKCQLTEEEFIKKHITDKGFSIKSRNISYLNNQETTIYLISKDPVICINPKIPLYDLTWNDKVIVSKVQKQFAYAMKNKLKKSDLYKGFDSLWKVKFNTYQNI